jgi:hypothetical protein
MISWKWFCRKERGLTRKNRKILIAWDREVELNMENAGRDRDRMLTS